MKTLSCDLCDAEFSAETFQEWMQLMMPHYMSVHADVMEANKKQDKRRWRKMDGRKSNKV